MHQNSTICCFATLSTSTRRVLPASSISNFLYIVFSFFSITLELTGYHMKIPRSRILSLLVSHVLFIGRGTPKLLKNVLFIEANTLFSGLGVLSPSIIFNIITYIYKMCHIKIHITWYRLFWDFWLFYIRKCDFLL